MARTSVDLRPRDSARLGVSLPATITKRYPWVLQDRWGNFHRADTPSGNVWYRRSNFGTPPYAATVQVTTGGLDCAPRMVKQFRERLILLFTRETSEGSGDFDGWETYSDDDGFTWSTPAMAFSGGKWAAPAVGNYGEIVRMARVGTNIEANVQWPGDASPRANFTFRDEDGVAIEIEDDGFYIASAKEGPNRWVGSWVVLGEGATSDWECSDMDGDNPATWSRVT